MNYYLIEENQKVGPLTHSDLVSKKIDSSTLVWKSGFKNWTQAGKVKDLTNVLKTIQRNKIESRKNLPPPIPTAIEIKKSKKYDLTYKKESEATVFGIFFLIVTISIPLILTYGGFVNSENEVFINRIMSSSRAVVHLLLTFWGVAIAKRQNRNQVGWGFFTFFLAPISLIILGQLNKFIDKPVFTPSNTLTDEQKRQIQIRKLKESKSRNKK